MDPGIQKKQTESKHVRFLIHMGPFGPFWFKNFGSEAQGAAHAARMSLGTQIRQISPGLIAVPSVPEEMLPSESPRDPEQPLSK